MDKFELLRLLKSNGIDSIYEENIPKDLLKQVLVEALFIIGNNGLEEEIYKAIENL